MKYLSPFFLLFALSAPHPAMSQKPAGSFEFNIGYALRPNQFADDGFRGTDNGNSVNNRFGALAVTSRYYISNKITVGLCMAYANENGDWDDIYYDPPVAGAPPGKGSYKRRTYTIAPEVSLTYVDGHNGFVRFYGSAAAGFTFVSEEDTYSRQYYEYAYNNGVNTLGNNLSVISNKIQTNFYISPLGVHIGKTLGCFFELGSGFKGFINGGLTYKIK